MIGSGEVLNGRSDVFARRNAGQGRSQLIELVFHELESAWSMEIIRGVEDVASEKGMSVVLVFSDLPAEYRQMLRSRAIPFVIIDPAGDPSPDVPSVSSANWSGGLMATRHLIELGHRRIAAITGPEDMMCSHARLDGYRSAMNAAGLPIDPAWVHYGDFHVSGGRDHARTLLEGDDPPTAIFAGSDLQALGVYETARTLGLRVPEQLSVVGYDDIPLAEWVSPRLTTVNQPLRLMGEEAARLVIQLSEGPLENTPRMDFATSLVVRESTAAPSA